MTELWLAVGPTAASRIAGWTDPADINEVMLATSLAPEGFLGIR